jgi:hypothetical protein
LAAKAKEESDKKARELEKKEFELRRAKEVADKRKIEQSLAKE